MNCPHCNSSLENNILKEIIGTVYGSVDILNASEFDSDEEGEEYWSGEIEREESGSYLCYNCNKPLNDRLVWNYFSYRDNPEKKEKEYRCDKTIDMFGRDL